MSITRNTSEEVVQKGSYILDYFDFSIKHTVSYLLLTLEMMNDNKIGNDEIKFYQDVLYWVTRVYKPKDGINKWQICPICNLYSTHSEDCTIKKYTQ